jgi:hypothetical protein
MGRRALVTQWTNDADAQSVACLLSRRGSFRSPWSIRQRRPGRRQFAEAAFGFLPVRARLDIAGFGEDDIFSH